MNKLDNSVIVSRDVINRALWYATQCEVQKHEAFQALKDSLRQDLSGWVAVPVKSHGTQLLFGAKSIEGLSVKKDKEGETCIEGGTAVAANSVYKAMLEASPPLPDASGHSEDAAAK